MYSVLALAVFEHCSYQAVWAKLGAGLRKAGLVSPAASSLSRARLRLGSVPLRRRFEVLPGRWPRPSTFGHLGALAEVLLVGGSLELN